MRKEDIVEMNFRKRSKKTENAFQVLKRWFDINRFYYKKRFRRFEYKSKRVRGAIIMDLVAKSDGKLFLIDIKLKTKLHDEDKAKMKKDAVIVELFSGKIVIPILIMVYPSTYNSKRYKGKIFTFKNGKWIDFDF